VIRDATIYHKRCRSIVAIMKIGRRSLKLAAGRATRSSKTRWGGRIDGRAAGSGFFRVDELDGVWWLIDPEGGRFISKGVCNVTFDPDHVHDTDRAPYAAACLRKYGSADAWRTAVARRLTSWGFNSLGAWSDEAVAAARPSRSARWLAVAPIVYLGGAFISHEEKQTKGPVIFPDVFDPDFFVMVRQRAADVCTPRRDDPGLIGWFTDNELQWGPDWRNGQELLTYFLNRPGSAGRAAAIGFLRGRYATIARFKKVWGGAASRWDDLSPLDPPYRREGLHQQDTDAERQRNLADPRRAAFIADCDAFAGVAAERYFAITAAAVRGADPNHLVLGPRFGYLPPSEVIAAAGGSLDVIGFNAYDADPVRMIDAYAQTGRPCLIGEFSFRGDDSGLPNTRGGGLRVATQKDRANSFERYVTAGLRRKNLVGYHWFEHADQPAEGRFDGEDSNYGTVTIDDEVYDELTRAMTALNARAEKIHAASAEPTA
jgi:agarase